MNEWEGNGWTRYQKLVLAQLENHYKDLKQLEKDISDLRVEISALKVQAGVWGMIAGLIPVSIAIIMGLLSK